MDWLAKFKNVTQDETLADGQTLLGHRDSPKQPVASFCLQNCSVHFAIKMMFLRNFSPFDANTGKLSAWRLWLWQDVAILLIFGSAMLFSQAFIFNFIAKWAGWLTMVPGVSSLAAKLLPSTVAANLLPLFATALGGLAIGFAALILRVLARNDAGAAGDIGIYHLALVAVWFLTM